MKTEIWVDGNGNKMEQIFCEECQEQIGWVNEGEDYPALFCDMCCLCDMKYSEKESRFGGQEK